jgi:hypothetical protein
MLMKRYVVTALFAAVLFASLNAAQISMARASGLGSCSLANVAGDYGFTYNGLAITSSGTIPVAAVGNFHTDASGNFTGTEINNLAGTAAYQTLVGTMTVRPNCAGELVARVYQQRTLVRTSYIHVQYEDNKDEMLAIFEKLVLPDNSTLPVVITIDCKRLSHS